MVRVKEFKEKSENLKKATGTEDYEKIAEDLRKDEKKLGVSQSNYVLCFMFWLEYHKETGKSTVCCLSSFAQYCWGSSDRKEDEE